MAKKKGATKGTGGKGKRSLAGRGPTPKAEDRPYHKAYKKKLAGNNKPKRSDYTDTKPVAATRGGVRKSDEFIAGRNSVVEALRAGIPIKAVYIAQNIVVDDRVKESIELSNKANLAILECSKADLDRMTDQAIHQGVAVQIPPYKYANPLDLLEKVQESGQTPLLLALDGITDPRNLGAIMRSVGAFGGQGVIIPERRSVGMTSAAWKTSAGAGLRVPVAKASNLNNVIKELKRAGCFVVGLDMSADVELPHFELGAEPLVLVIGAEGEGISHLTRQLCDQIVSIPMAAATESLNAGVAAGIALYQISVSRNS
ncbi:MAG: 23S rRNA (guanosine(2251)-2'-O)-methyltransferase RlmB [Micrococcaceae bacterium]